MVVPTLVIGVGMGGIRVVQTLAEFVKARGEQANYRFIAIDSNEQDLQEQIKRGYNVSTVAITEKGFEVEEMISRCPYLYEGMERKGTGALRDRSYGRFLLDLNISNVKDHIDASLKELKDKWKKELGEKKGLILIWLVHTVGGGTGSGTFPSIVVNVHESAKNILEDADIKPLIFGLGILPSATNIKDITHATFYKKYLANSFAALRELKLLANPKELVLTPYNPYGSTSAVKIEKRPFNRYFFFGIDEELVSELKDEEAEVVDEYLTSSNKVIANAMYAVPTYLHGFENLWLHVNSPYVAFGESELIAPISETKKIAEENDRLGRPLDEELKKTLKGEVELVLDTAIGELNEGFLEAKCTAILDTYKLRGLSYFIGKLQNEFNKYTLAAQTDFKDTVDEIFDTLSEEEWAKAMINITEELSLGEKEEKIRELIDKRKLDNQKTIDSPLPRPLMKRQLTRQNEKLEKWSEELDEKRDRLEKLKLLKSHIDLNLCRSLRKEIGHERDGVADVVNYIRTCELELEKWYENLSKKGYGRVVKLGVEEGKAEDLTLMGKGLNVANVDSIPDFIKTFDITENDVDTLIKNRISQAADLPIRIGVVASEEGHRETPSKELWILCHKDNEPTLGKHESAFTGWKKERIITDTFDREKYVFVNFRLGHLLEDIKEYRYRKEEYESGSLARTTGLEEDRIGEIFAYPEWFMDDENVRRVFEGSKKKT